jgi:hypothetical protein
MDQGIPLTAISHKQGFVDENGAFLGRADAWARAVACSQIKDDGGTRLLTSEMLNRHLMDPRGTGKEKDGG